MINISKSLALPPDVVTSTLVIYGGKGMGKTNFGSVLVEEMTKKHLRWAVLDPLGVWWGLRHSADGQGPGIECLIVGGLHGDLPLEPTAGAVVADLVAEEEGTNVVIDFSRKQNGQMWSMGEKVKFVTEYALRLFQRQGEITNGRRRSPIMQILDESARYIPQMIPSGAIDLAKCVGAWEQVTEEGRNVGLGVTFLTQRSARMNKSVSELADAMISFRIVGPRSIEAVTDWLGTHVEKSRQKEIVEQVRSLPVGHALVVSPGWLGVESVVQMRMRETFDSSATPKPGERRKEPGKAAKPDLEKYKTRMAETIEKAKADDPKFLRREIVELKKQLARNDTNPAPIKVVDEKTIAKAIASALAPLHEILKSGAEHLDRTIKANESAIKQMASDQERHRALGERIREALKNGKIELVKPTVHHAKVFGTPERVVVYPPNGTTGQSTDLSKPQRAILTALARFASLNVLKPSKNNVGALAGYSPKGGSFSTYLSQLSSAGFIAYPGSGLLSLTPEGKDAIGGIGSPPSLEEYQAAWFDLLPGAPHKKILGVLLQHYPESITRTELGELSGYAPTGGSFSTYLSKLSSLGLIKYVQGSVTTTDLLFPRGLK